MRLLMLVEFLVLTLLGAVPPGKPYRLPDRPDTPQPMPAADAGFRLTPATLFVIDSDTELVVVCSPTRLKLVVVSHEEGPVKIRGVFVDSKTGGKPETRTYRGKHVYTIDAVHTGTGEVIVIPVGAKEPTDVIPIEVVDGTGPQPPPNPGPQPDPKPFDPAKLYVVVVEETESAAAGRGAMFADKALAQRFAEKGHRWRIVDKDVQGADGKPPEDVKQFLDDAKGKALPRLYLVSIDGGKRVVRFAGDCPAKAADLLELLKKYGG